MRSFSHSCTVFASTLSAFAVSLPLLFASSSASAIEGEVSRLAYSGDWVSTRICFTDECHWRAVTLSSNLDDRGLFIDFFPQGELSVTLQSLHISQKNLKSWRNSREDTVRAEFRVDTNPIIDAVITRTLEPESRTIFEALPEELSNWHFVEQLRTGTTLRIRHHRAETLIERFSLKGAQKAIDRARTMSSKERNARSADERYFDETPLPSKSKSDTEFFL